jgi:hypothetical protein
METISEQEFIKLCDGIYDDLHQVHEWNPSLSRRDAFLWMLLGSLVSLLSVPILEQPSVYDPSKSDPYLLAVLEVLAGRCEGSFDPTDYLSRVLGQIEE